MEEESTVPVVVDAVNAVEPSDPDEMRITANGYIRHYVGYALRHLEGKKPTEDETEVEVVEAARKIVIKGIGRAINKAVSVVEIVKRRVPDLHQSTEIYSHEFVGDDDNPRFLPAITVVLSKDEMDSSQPGYQPPLSEEKRQRLLEIENMERSSGRSRVKKPEGDNEEDIDQDEAEREDDTGVDGNTSNRSKGGRGRGRYRGGRRGRYYRGRGRGRGRGREAAQTTGETSAPAVETE